MGGLCPDVDQTTLTTPFSSLALPTLLPGLHRSYSRELQSYFQLVERLFRQKKLKLVISTSSLSYGINMPARSTVFWGKNVHANPMIFQQCAGRAGRRGIESTGKVIFVGFGWRSMSWK